MGRGRVFLAGVTAQAGAGRLQRAGCGQVSGYSPTGSERRGNCERRVRTARLLLRVDAPIRAQPLEGLAGLASGVGFAPGPPGSRGRA